MHTPVRIAYVIWSLGLGGAEKVVIHLATGLDRTRFSPVIFCLNEPGPFAPEVLRQGIEVIGLHKRGPADILAAYRLYNALKAGRFDVVHTHLWGANVWGRLAARLAGVPVIIATEHNVPNWKTRWHFLLDRMLAPATTRLVAVSQAVLSEYERRKIAPLRWTLISNGVSPRTPPVPGRDDARRALGLPPSGTVIGWMGRFAVVKNPLLFAEAAAIAVRKAPSLMIILAGDGPLRPALEQKINALGIRDRVVFAGVLHDIPAFLAALDAIAFSSDSEGLSMAMLEAMAAGVPVVATAVGGTRELVRHEITGFLVPPRDADALAGGMVRVISDPDLAETLRRNATDFTRREHAESGMIRRHDSLYRECLHGRRERYRLMLIIDSLGNGGAEPQLVKLATALAERDVRVSVISLSADRMENAHPLRAAGIPLAVVPQSGFWSWRTLLRLRRIIGRERPDIVHTWLFTSDLYGRIAARLAGVPIVMSASRGLDIDKPIRRQWADRILRPLTTAYTVNARAVGDMLMRRERVPAGKIFLIPNGVASPASSPTDTPGETRRRLGVPASGFLVGGVGRLVPVKGFRTLLETIRRMGDAGRAVHVCLAGDGPLREELLNLAARLGISDRVTFAGHQNDMRGILAAFDVLVSSSLSEGCSNVILEAMAAGKPVIATEVGGNPELVTPGETGLLVPPEDPAALADAILRLLRNPGECRRMGEAGRLRVEEHFTMDRMVSETAALYERLLAGRKLL
ncbi:MAG: glycosyltransferase [Planctomycetota bacterium]